MTANQSSKYRIQDLDTLLAQMDEVREDVMASPDVLGDPWGLFVRKMRLITPQSWGSRVEAWLRQHHGWDKVGAGMARGDAKTKDGFFEIKTSMITPTNPRANFVQIRPAHNMDGYHLFVVESDFTLVHMTLSVAQMSNELDRLGGLAHGTIAQRGNDGEAEFSIRILWNDDDPARAQFARYEVSRGAAGEACCTHEG